MSTTTDWGVVADGFREPRTSRGWYVHHARIHSSLLRSLDLAEPILKTDLFEEATGTHSLLDTIRGSDRRTVCMDIDPRIVRMAARRLGTSSGTVAADVCSLPFASGSLGTVVSLSTLDHFSDVDHIRTALTEISRVLRPGGHAVITFDNLDNPVIRLRTAIPASVLRSSGAMAFAPGVTLGLRDAAAAVRAAGLRVIRAEPLLHAPRLPILASLRAAARLGLDPPLPRVLRAIGALERLARALGPRANAQYVALVARAPREERRW